MSASAARKSGGVREARSAAQRDRILDAAQTCFTEHGFHGASMAAIADTAKMSPGLIYRYFDSKREIILGIVERQLDWILEDIAEGQLGANGPVETLVQGYLDKPLLRGKHCTIEPALFLEIIAESSRDAEVARALQHFDDALESAARKWIGRAGLPTADGQGNDLPARMFALRCFIDGLKVRQVRQPDVDREVLHQAITRAFECLRAG